MNKFIFPKELLKDLKQYFNDKEIRLIKKNLGENAANREKEILSNYDSIELEGTTILNIYDKDKNGFGIDARKELDTLGGICN